MCLDLGMGVGFAGDSVLAGDHDKIRPGRSRGRILG